METCCSSFFSLLKSRCSGFEILPPLSHYAAFLSVFHKVVHFPCLALVVVWVVVELQICLNMVLYTTIIKVYQDTIREIPYVTKTSFQQHSLGFCGNAEKKNLRDVLIQ